MPDPHTIDLEKLSRVVLNGLSAGKPVEIDGLGTFHPDLAAGFRFEPALRRRVFIAYGKEDMEQAERLYEDLQLQGFRPWMDTRKLLPGQNWPRAIENAIEISDFFVACFSTRSVRKRGGFQAEIRYALACARRVPLDDIFLIPVRLDDCRVPGSIQREWQYIDLFPDRDAGIRKLLATMRAGFREL
jgi:hypothetical protein